jgi:hypothetical protein
MNSSVMSLLLATIIRHITSPGTVATKLLPLVLVLLEADEHARFVPLIEPAGLRFVRLGIASSDTKKCAKSNEKLSGGCERLQPTLGFKQMSFNATS